MNTVTEPTKFWIPSFDHTSRVYLCGPGEPVGVHYVHTAKQYRMFFCPRHVYGHCAACDAAHEELEFTGELSEWRLHPRRLYHIIDMDDEDAEIQMYVAGIGVTNQINLLGTRAISIKRYGSGMLTQHKVYSHRLWPITKLTLTLALREITLPPIPYPPEEELEAWFPSALRRELVNLDEPWADVSDYNDRIPFDQGVATA